MKAYFEQWEASYNKAVRTQMVLESTGATVMYLIAAGLIAKRFLRRDTGWGDWLMAALVVAMLVFALVVPTGPMHFGSKYKALL